MIVGYNEEKLLSSCLNSISFCDEIIYTDLGSQDHSVAVANNYSSAVYQHALVPSCEMIQAEVVHTLKYDWVLFIDPDEVLDPSLANEIIKRFPAFLQNETLAAIMVPWQFYFKKYKLKGTVWGGTNKKFLLVNRHRFDFKPVVHYGRKILPGFDAEEIEFNGEQNVLHHYWMDSFKVFINKHRRYLKNEAIDQYAIGIRSGKKDALLKPYFAFKESYVTRKGYKDGLIGFFLSVFWGFYKAYISYGLLKLQAKQKNG